MKKQELARQLAKESHITPAAAADQLDRVLHEILTRVRQGQTAGLPGLGTFRLDQKDGLQFALSFPPGSERGKSKKESR